MTLALLELRRRPWRFAPAVIALVLLTGLLLTLGGLLDGLYNGFTGALRNQPGPLLTYSIDAKLSLVRSRIDATTTEQIERVPGVEWVGGLGTVLLGAEVPGQAIEASVALFGYQAAPQGVPAPPADTGRVYADTSLRAYGVREGQTLLLGPKRYPVSVVGWVSDSDFLLQGSLWGNVETWREVLGSARPDQVLAPGTYQVLTISTAPGTDPGQVAAAIDAATGETQTVTRSAAVDSIPGVTQQRATFNAIIDTTFFVAALVVALFFVLLTIERVGMYAVFKAVGASSGQLFGQVVLQAFVLTVLSFVVGALLAVALSSLIPPQVPLQLSARRAVEVAAGLVVMSALGSSVSLRRVVRIDPATAIG